MPIQRCKSNGKLGWKWGKSGKCYVGSGALAKARRQERAIRASGWVEHVRRPVRTTVVPSNPLKADPTRTTTLRRRFEIDLRRRFNRLRKMLTALIVEEDALGIKQRTKNPFIGNQRWRFHSTQQKVEEFRNWLQTQTNLNILAEGIQEEQKYWKAYIQEGYDKGAGRAFDDTNAARRAMAGGSEQLAFFQGTREEFLRSAFAHPVSVDRVKVLAGRVFTELKGVTESMAQRMTRELTDGLTQGKNPRDIARDLNKALDIGKNRSRVIARTEIIRAHGEGQLDTLERLGVEEVGVAVEWSTAGDDRVCPLCAPLEGIVMKVKEARGTIPRHPNCRCSYIPANVGEKQKGQVRGKGALDKARNDSIRAEIPKRSKRTLAQQKALSKWPGADTKFKKVRPKSILDQPRSLNKRTIERCGGLTVNAPGACGVAKSEIARLNAKRVGREVQRYSEEHNEAMLAKSLGKRAKAIDDNAPHDIQWRDRGKTHGIEVKTLVDNSNNKLTMKRTAMDRKAAWVREKKDRVFHTIVLDDGSAIPGNSIEEKSNMLAKFLESGCCVDLKKRRIFYRRGYGSFRVGGMHEVKNIKELRKLIRMEISELPKGAV